MKAFKPMFETLLATSELFIAIAVIVLMRGVDRVRQLIPGISVVQRDRSAAENTLAANTAT
ncbi:MAG: hypothetical protein JSR77_00445 [Planctomycetes bacterium]|nr:hypothetical protein [Planctomycetota bacterium]